MAPANLADMVAEQVKRTPDAVAVIWDGGEERCCLRITYQELWQRGCQVCKELQKLAAEKETVGVCAEPGINLPSALLGILQASCSYFPFGLDGLGFVRQSLQKLNVKYLLLDTICFQRLGSLLMELQSLVIPSSALQALGFHLVLVRPVTDITQHMQPVCGLAYCITTSGTTGTPKIVRVPHSCIVPNVLDFRKEFLPTVGDITFLTSPLTFDPSVIDIFMTLTSGAALLLVATVVKMSPDHLLTMLTMRHRVSLLQITPSLFRLFDPKAVKRTLLGASSPLRVLAFGGETFPPYSVFDNCMRSDNRTILYNVYGITELSAWASLHCARHPEGPVQDAVPIGKALTGTKIKVTDEQGNELKAGTGHILIGGNVRTCLLNEEGEELLESGGVWRRTGDIGMIDVDGNILCLGRDDRQIKRLGKRMDLDTLQNVCMDVHGVEDSLAVYSQSKLLMFVKVQKSSDEDSERLCSKVKAHLLEMLPSQYQPDDVAIVPDFPVNAHGKLNVPALLNKLHDDRSFKNQQQHLPVEKWLCTLWQDATNLTDVRPAPTDKFLSCGGDSLRAVQLVDNIECHLGHHVPDLLDIILTKTWADLLSLIQQHVNTTSMELLAEKHSHFSKDTNSGSLEEILRETRPSQKNKHGRLKKMDLMGSSKTAMSVKDLSSKEKDVGDLFETVQPLPCYFRKGSAFSETKPAKRKDHHSRSGVSEEVDVSEPSVKPKVRKLNSPNLETDLEISSHNQSEEENLKAFLYTHALPANVLLCGRGEASDQLLPVEPKESCPKETVSSVIQLRSEAVGTITQPPLSKQSEQDSPLSGSVAQKVMATSPSLVELQKENILMGNDAALALLTDSVSPEMKDGSEGDGLCAEVFDVSDLFVSSVSRASSQLFTRPHTILNSRQNEDNEGDSSGPGDDRKIQCAHSKFCECGYHKDYSSALHLTLTPSGSSSCSEVTQNGGHGLQLKFQWVVDTGKCVDASPLAATTKCGRTVVFIGSHSHKFLAINMHSGEVVWSTELGDRVEGSACLSPCGQHVVVGCYDNNIYVLSAGTGEVTWQVKTGDMVKCSPVADSISGLVFCGSHDGFLYALHCKNQQIQWKCDAGGRGVFASPVVNPDGCAVYAATLGGYVTAVDIMTGITLWRISLGKPVFSSPAICTDRLYIGCVDSALYCVSCNTGDKVWVFKTEAPVFSSPVVATTSISQHSILFGCHDRHVYCLTDSGQLVWKVETSSTVYASPFVFCSHGTDQQMGYCGDNVDHSCKRKQPGKECVADCSSDNKHCRKREICEAEKDTAVMSEFTVQNLTESDTHGKFTQESCLEAEANKDKTRDTDLGCSDSCCIETPNLMTETAEESRAESVNDKETEAHSKLVVCASTTGTINVLCCSTGEKVCSITLPGDVFSSPVIVGNHLVVGCRDNNIYCYELLFCGERDKMGTILN